MSDRAETSEHFYAAGSTDGGVLNRYRTLVDTIDDGLYQLDADGRFVAANDAVVELTGYERRDLLGTHVSQVLDDASVARYEGAVRTLLRTEPDEIAPVDLTVRTADGETVACELRPSPLLTDGEFRGTAGTLRRVDGAETAAPPSESVVVDVLDDAAVGVFVLDADFEVAWTNSTVERYFGLDHADVVGRDKRRLVEREISHVVADPDAFAETVLATYGDNTYVERFECRVTAGDGRDDRWLEHRSKPIDAGSYAGGRVELYYDVTERKRSEQALRERERQLQDERDVAEQILETSAIGLAVVEPGGEMVRSNRRMAELFAIPDDEFPSLAERPVGRATETGEAVTGQEIRVDASDDQSRWISVNATPITDEAGEVDRIVVAATDVTQLKAQTRQLERQRDDLRNELAEVFDRVADGFFALDTDWRFTYLNERAEELIDGTEDELLGTVVREKFPELIGTAFQKRSREAMESQEPVSFEEYYPPLDTWFEVRAYPSETGLSVYFRDVTERKAREQELERQREQLAALNELNDVVREITEAVVNQSTREEIEQTVCDSLAASDSYRFAWIGEIDPTTETIAPQVEAGVDEYLETITLSTDPDDPRGRGPAGRAIRTQEIQVVQDALEDPLFEPWREYAEEFGYRSAAAIPITYEETIYGLLGIYTERRGAFADDERAVIGQLGEIVGHAIASVERKRALMSDDLVELDVRVRDVFELFGVPATDEPIVFDRTVPVGDDEFLQYGTTTEAGMETLQATVGEVSYWKDVTDISHDFDECTFELRLSEPPMLSIIASHGGSIEGARIEDGDFHLTFSLPQGADVRHVIEAVQTEYPSTEALARRQRPHPNDTTQRVGQTWIDDLTDRQRTALEVAYFAGFFEWPRNTSGEDVADSLGVAPATFHQHLRKAERKLVGALFHETLGRE